MNAAAEQIFAAYDEESRMSTSPIPDEALWKPPTPEQQIVEQQDEIDALRSHIAGANARRSQRTAALFCIAGILAAASTGPPLLFVLAMIAAGAGVVSWVGRK